MSQDSSDNPQAAAAGPAAEPTPLADILTQGRVVARHAPWPRAVVGAVEWTRAAGELAAGRVTLVALWGEAAAVHMALHEPASGLFAVLSLDCPDHRYPSVAQWHAPALRPERAARDLFGLEPQGLADARPWLDHDRWGLRHPLAVSPQPAGEVAPLAPYAFLPVEGEALHQIPVGPVHAGIIEPGHFRFTASGETVVRLEARLGYVHKGIERLMAGADLAAAVRLAGRVSGDSTVAYALAFARAAEAALGIEAPPRAQYLRAVMAELERIANHVGDFGAICNDASFSLMHAHCGVLRERVLRAADIAFGHRLMRDRIMPGGVTADLSAAGIEALRAVIAEFRRRFPELVELYENTASLQDRTVGTGILSAELAARFGAGGYVGRASGRGFDARRAPGYAPYGEFDFDVAVVTAGDVHARVMVRIAEIEASLGLIEALLAALPAGPLSTALPAAAGAGEGAALVEGFRGDIFVWLRLGGKGHVARCHLRDPSWFQWPLLEVAIDGNIVADFPLCNKSFNCSYSGHDL